MDEIIKRHKKRCSLNNNIRSKNILNKILLSIILILSIIIYNKYNPSFKDKIFSNSKIFMNINNLYNKYLGNVLPSFKKDNTLLVSSEVDNYEDYLDGVKINTSGSVKVKESGLLVFYGDKEGYNKTAIIEGVDGVDIWYGNLDNINYKMYDYIEKDSIIGSSKDYYYLVIVKDNNYIKYEEYNKTL